MNEPKTKPIHEIKFGRCRATIWRNDTKNGPMPSVTLSRLYKNDADEWRDSTSFSRDDLPLLIKAAEQAYAFLYQDLNVYQQTLDVAENGAVEAGTSATETR